MLQSGHSSASRVADSLWGIQDIRGAQGQGGRGAAVEGVRARRTATSLLPKLQVSDIDLVFLVYKQSRIDRITDRSSRCDERRLSVGTSRPPSPSLPNATCSRIAAYCGTAKGVLQRHFLLSSSGNHRTSGCYARAAAASRLPPGTVNDGH